MKNLLLVTMIGACFLLGMAPAANAGVVTWYVLQDPLVALAGPGPNGVIGVPGCAGTADNDDTPSLENNKCNFSNKLNCAGGGLPNPTVGSYSYGAPEFNMSKSCDGGSNAGGACTDDSQCPGGTCMDCTGNPSGADLIYYEGDVGNSNGNGTMTLCQENGSSFTFTSFKMGTSESVPGMGPACINLKTGGTYTGSPCGLAQSVATVSLTTKIMNCAVPIGDTIGLVSNGRAYDVDDASPAAMCGYSSADILCLLNRAKTLNGAKFLMISCTNQTLGASTATCLTGADSNSVTVAWTANDASDCVSACGGGGGCMAGTAESVE